MRPALRNTLLVLVILVAAAIAWRLHTDHMKSATPEYTSTAVVRGDIEESVTAQGKLEAKQYVDVGTQVSGQLKTLRVDFGDNVKKGDLIAEIDPQIYQSRVEADEAHLQTLQAEEQQQAALVDQAKQKLDRAAKLIKQKAISQEAYDDAKTAVKTADAQLAALKAQVVEQQSTLDGDKANLGYTKIYAPIDGTIVSESVKQGQTVNASQSAPVIVQIADLDTMTVRAQVAEADIMRLKEGMPAFFTTLGARDRRWKGTVRQILPSPEVINDVVLYDVLIDADNKDRQLMTGMSTQVFFILGDADDALLIPVAALGRHMHKEDTDKAQAYRVRVIAGNAVQEKTVHIGLMDRSNAQVLDGLNEGDRVVTSAPKASPASSSGQHNGAGGGGMRGGGGPRL